MTLTLILSLKTEPSLLYCSLEERAREWEYVLSLSVSFLLLSITFNQSISYLFLCIYKQATMPKQYLPLLGQPIALYRQVIIYSLTLCSISLQFNLIPPGYVAVSTLSLACFKSKKSLSFAILPTTTFFKVSSFLIFHNTMSCLSLLPINIIYSPSPQMPKEIGNQTSNLHCLEKKDRILFTTAFRNVLFFFFFFACLIICIMKYFYVCCISLAQFYIN